MKGQSKVDATVVGGGLAGCEAAWQLARLGASVRLIEMKPSECSAAHTSPVLAELVCSNSLRSNAMTAPAGLLKAELRQAGSLIIDCADATSVPAGDALAVDRLAFGRLVTFRIASHPNITLERRPIYTFPDGPVILATGPLTGSELAKSLRKLCGEQLYFYDAIAPIVDGETIDWNHAFRASRLSRGRRDRAALSSAEAGAGLAEAPADQTDGDYINCPLDEAEYRQLVLGIRAGRKVLPHSFEEPHYFEGCLPVEVMADRGDEVLSHGPMRPIGLVDPRTGKRPHAVLQLRAENRHGAAYNMVGFQTRLAYPEQKRIFSLIPALAQAEFFRFGSIHRNAYVHSPSCLDGTLRLRQRPSTRLAGQITGVEGYIESTAMGLLAGWFLAAELAGRLDRMPLPPGTMALGGLLDHVTRPRAPGERFEPTNIHFGLLPQVEIRGKKMQRRQAAVDRACASATAYWASAHLVTPSSGLSGLA